MRENRVTRTEGVAFALGITCIVLTLALISAFETYPPMIYDRNDKITSVQNQVNNLTDALNLQNATVWVNNETYSQKAGSYSVIEGSPEYAGYIFVNVKASTTNTTYVRVRYRYTADDDGVPSGYNNGFFIYDNQVEIGTNGTAAFPVLPALAVLETGGSANVEIRIGNTNLLSEAIENETVTITYRW